MQGQKYAQNTSSNLPIMSSCRLPKEFVCIGRTCYPYVLQQSSSSIFSFFVFPYESDFCLNLWTDGYYRASIGAQSYIVFMGLISRTTTKLCAMNFRGRKFAMER